jgi:hypothetical protein
MRDLEIRSALRQYLAKTFANDSTALILDELGICSGAVRIDMAVVNGELKGFEIKSDYDTLDRLPSQSSAYNRVFDTLTIIVGARHIKKVEVAVPTWWGIFLVEGKINEHPPLEAVRLEGANPCIDPLALVQLLWRDEALSLLEASGIDVGLRNKPRRFLWQALVESFPLSEIREMVRMQLKAREGWRAGSQRTLSDGMFQPSAKS